MSTHLERRDQGLTVMWEGKWRECLVGLGLTSEFLVPRPNLRGTNAVDGLQPVIKGVCLELQYNINSM